MPSYFLPSPMITLDQGSLLVATETHQDKEQGRNNFRNYASQLQATFARSQIPKVSNYLAIPSIFVISDRTNLTQIYAPTWKSYFVPIPWFNRLTLASALVNLEYSFKLK